MGQRSRRRARYGVREAGGTALRNDNAIRARCQRRSNDRAQVVRILDAVKQNDQSFLTMRRVGAGQNALERGSGASCRNCNDALMVFRVSQAIELAALLKSHGNALLA